MLDGSIAHAVSTALNIPSPRGSKKGRHLCRSSACQIILAFRFCMSAGHSNKEKVPADDARGHLCSVDWPVE